LVKVTITPNVAASYGLSRCMRIQRKAVEMCQETQMITFRNDLHRFDTGATDLTQVLTGRQGTFDEWLPLLGTGNTRGRVRIVCEYEASNTPP
jgi:hypothetical protein